MQEVIGVFADRTEAQRAADELFSRGYDSESIGYLGRHRDNTGNVVVDDGYDVDTYESDAGEEAAKGAAGGAAGGAATGLGAALLASAGMLAVPGVGPFLAAGTVAGTLAATGVGAAGGAAFGGAVGAIVGAASDEDEDDVHPTSTYYRNRLDEGSSVVSVNVADENVDEVSDLMRGAGADRVNAYNQGWVN